MSSPSRASNLLFLLIGAASVAVVAALLAGAGVFDSGDEAPSRGARAQAAQPSGTAGTGGAPTSVADIYEQASPAVVFVQATSGARGGSGSGFVIDDDGKIVTNQHVIDGARQLRIRFGEDGDLVPARLLGEDASTDLALLKVDAAKMPEGLEPLELAPAERRLRPGEATIAIGAPFGLAGSVTTGVVSALDRDIESPNGFSISGVVQTDAAINPGNSGGPLLDAEGQAIGVNSQIATSGGANAGVGFAVPVRTVREVVPLLERDGKIRRPYLGVSTGDAPGTADGAVVGTVVPGGPAARAGLRPGDRIVAVAGTPIKGSREVSEAIARRKVGERVEVRLVRGGQERTVTVRLGERPDQAQQPG